MDYVQLHIGSISEKQSLNCCRIRLEFTMDLQYAFNKRRLYITVPLA